MIITMTSSMIEYAAICDMVQYKTKHKSPRSRSYAPSPLKEPASLFHGTCEEYAWSIMLRGFSLVNECWGRGWGNGVYLSSTDEFASTWGSIIIHCRLQAGTRLLWHKDYDRKVIDSLRREFGKAIVSPAFWKVLPLNKQLTRNEVIQLWHYLVTRHYKNPRRFRANRLEHLQKNYSRLYKQLRRHGYDGVGFRNADWPEILVFNPARVQPVSAHRYDPPLGRTDPHRSPKTDAGQGRARLKDLSLAKC